MLTFALGAMFGGIVSVIVMSVLIVGSRADESSK